MFITEWDHQDLKELAVLYNIKTLRVNLGADSEKVTVSGYVEGDCISGIHLYGEGETFQSAINKLEDKVIASQRTTQQKIAKLKQQIKELEVTK